MSDRLFTPRFLALWVFAFITFFSAFQLLPAIPFRILELGGSKTAAGLFLTVYTLASAFAAPLMGTLADHVGRRRMLVAVSVLFIGFSLLYGVVTWLPALLLIGVLHGSIWSGILSSASAIMSEFIPPSRRTQGLAFWGLASTAAIAVAPPVGMMVFRYGWLTLCIELAALSVVMAVWSSLLPSPPEARPESLPELRDAWDWNVIRATLSLTVVSFGYGGITSYVAILSVERGIEPKSLYFTVQGAAIIFIRLFTSHLGDRFGVKAILYPSLIAIPVAFALLAGAHSREMLVVSAILFGFGLGCAYPAFANFIVTNTDERRRARTFGSIVWAFDTGIGTGSLVIGAIGDRYSLGTAFAVAAGISCLAIPIFAAGSRQLLRGTAVAAEQEHVATTSR
ncbi:MAG TPA: MFS transporter [Thermoanaerobaculia bacterium]|jgi:MFS family permease